MYAGLTLLCEAARRCADSRRRSPWHRERLALAAQLRQLSLPQQGVLGHHCRRARCPGQRVDRVRARNAHGHLGRRGGGRERRRLVDARRAGLRKRRRGRPPPGTPRRARSARRRRRFEPRRRRSPGASSPRPPRRNSSRRLPSARPRLRPITESRPKVRSEVRSKTSQTRASVGRARDEDSATPCL